MDAGPPPMDQCIGAMDQAVVAAFVPDGGWPDSGAFFDPVSEVFVDCAREDCAEAVFSSDHAQIHACMDACIDTSAADGLSAGCRDCYYLQIDCVLDECLVPCAVEISDDCLTCLDANCRDNLLYCRGF